MNNTKFYAFVGSPETMATYFEVVDTTDMDEQDIDSHLDTMSYTVGAAAQGITSINRAYPATEYTLEEAFTAFGMLMACEIKDR